MLKQNLGFGLATLITVVASGLFAACGEEADTPMTEPTATSTGTGTGAPTATGTATGTGTATTPSVTATGTTTPTDTATAMPTDSAMPTMTADPAPPGDAAMGMTQYTGSGCQACHGASGEGGLIGPNITGSMTAGIGGWSYAEFEAAIRLGTDPRGGTLCGTMTKYNETLITPEAMANLYAYLMSEMNDTAMPGGCAN